MAANADLIERLQKILAKTTSNYEGEAQVAAEMLQRLLEEHNLTIADLERKGQAAPSVREQTHDLGKAAFTWKLDLADLIAKHYYCHPLVNRGTKTVAFIGRPDNVESLQMLYQWLIDQIRRVSAETRKTHINKTGEHIDPLRWQVSFGVGVVERLGGRLEQIRQSRQQSAEAMALVVHHEAEISDYLEARYGYRTDGQMTKRQREENERHAQWLVKWEAEQKTKAEWKARDPEGYYNRYPWERPETPEQRKAREEQEAKEQRRWEARQRANAKRRQQYQDANWWRRQEREYSPEQERKDAQSYEARRAGRKAADTINLEPFIKGETPKPEPKKLG